MNKGSTKRGAQGVSIGANRYLISALMLFTLLSSQWAMAHIDKGCIQLISDLDENELYLSPDLKEIHPELNHYELIGNLTKAPTKDIKDFSTTQGIFVTKRDGQNNPVEGFIRVLSDNRRNVVQVTGDFNDWGHENRITLHPDQDPRYVVGAIPKIHHGMQYRLVINGHEMLDPAGLVQTTPEYNEKVNGKAEPYLNSVFWDLEGILKYHPKNKRVDSRQKAMAISENDIVALAKNWTFGDHVGPAKTGDTYKFIAESGIIPQLKEWGYNAIEFLPLTASVDGDVWASRYLNFGPWAIDSRWGTPREFQEMVDAFNGAGIAVVLDIVPGHFTQHGNLGVRDVAPIGIHNLKKEDGQGLYGNDLSEWGTLRYDYQNPYIRKFLVDGTINFIKYYGISGIRIDNYGGIEALPGGGLFLKELIRTVREYAPDIYVNAESFGGDNNVTKRIDEGGHGNTTHNSGDFFSFIYEFAQKSTDEIDMNVVRNLLRNPWGWRENAVLHYITNHDEAANGRGKATGAYFPDLVKGGGDFYADGKIGVFTAFAMFSGSFYLDMPHLRTLQEGNFYSNPNVQWDNLKLERTRMMSQFLADATKYYTGEPAFAFHNTHPDVENMTDYQNRIEVMKRVDFKSGKVIYVISNFGNRDFENYQFGIAEGGKFRLVLDRYDLRHGGNLRLSSRVTDGLVAENKPIQGKSHTLTLPHVAPYAVIILEK